MANYTAIRRKFITPTANYKMDRQLFDSDNEEAVKLFIIAIEQETQCRLPYPVLAEIIRDTIGSRKVRHEIDNYCLVWKASETQISVTISEISFGLDWREE
jgi:hypothetical protein